MLVGIVGTGLIGSSVGLAARAAGHATAGWDASAEALAGARRTGAIQTGMPTLEALAASCECIVLATPLQATLALLRAFPPAPSAQLITDVASVKAPVVAAASSVPGFVAGHPIAGSERSGPAAARGDLFAGRVWAYVPPADADLQSRAVSLFEALGATPVPVGAEQHDAVVAFTSHLPQLVATALGVALAQRIEDPVTAALCGSGMRDMTRLASSSWEVWDAVLRANRSAILDELHAFAGILGNVAEGLAHPEEPRLAEYFSDAAGAARRQSENERARSLVNRGTNDAD